VIIVKAAVNKDWLIEQLKNKDVKVVDCRFELGKPDKGEKLYQESHIPGAINKFWAEGLEQGRFKHSEEQKKRFAELDQAEPIIVYCGSGVTATPNYIAFKMAGFQNVKLYAGSYSDWVSYNENPVAKGKESY